VAAVAAFSLSGPTPIGSTKAYASKFDGKPYGAHARTRQAACFNNACSKRKSK